MNVYNLEGKVERAVDKPTIFNNSFRPDLVRRALLAEQSLRYQPQGHDVMAGLRTTAIYVGNYKSYRTGRHMGISIRPRQKLAGGGMGDVRRIPSAVKGRRAHPHKIEKVTVELINRKEYQKAILSAIAGCAEEKMVKEKHLFTGSVPIIIDDKIEQITKAAELMKLLGKLGIENDLEKSHKPKRRKGLSRQSKVRHFRKSVLLVVKNQEKVGRAGRNIPGVDVIGINNLTVEKLAPGGLPRLSIWSLSAVADAAKEIENKRLR